MPSVLMAELQAFESPVKEPWPDDVEMYVTHEVEQILLPESSSCLAVQAFFRMCGLRYKLQMRINAESMSPSGKIPFIRCGKAVVSELDPIVSFVAHRGISLTTELSDVEKSDMRAYMSLVYNVLGNAEQHLMWCDRVTFLEVTYPRFTSAFPRPLGGILCYLRQRKMRKKLRVIDWESKDLEKVYSEIDNCCRVLSERLGSQKYFFGNKPTELDALVFGHLFSLLTTHLPDSRLSAVVHTYDNLVELCSTVENEFFQRIEGSVSLK
ncbi:unnamed protein product [Notodromas monacha]|uniref:Metaxin 2 n=1 Tax=Notodromas monacha TaxID=399045 RepID=A0A7R9BH98_9CRUS|nr:unnamed protein product [Notodromas monacha]CAG0914087.1 unnamed protein product [Notodromas monacha]